MVKPKAKVTWEPWEFSEGDFFNSKEHCYKCRRVIQPEADCYSTVSSKGRERFVHLECAKRLGLVW